MLAPGVEVAQHLLLAADLRVVEARGEVALLQLDLAVFHGTILVRPGAQKTDALQVNRNLLLSKEALVNSTPAFEIHADDVKCKHGSTTGHLDAQALFYLCSRGLGQEAARSLLIHAFANEVVGRARLEPFRARVANILRQKLPAAPQGAIP